MAEYRQWHETNRTMLKDVIPLDTPYNLSFEVSSLCNARWVYCAHSGKHGEYEGNMSEEIFHKVLSDAKGFKHKIKKCGMFGFGESLCNPKLPEMIKEVNESGLVEAVDLTTNGLLLTPALSDKLIGAGLGTIRISIQGIDADMYWRMCRAKVDFEKFLDNLRYLYVHRGGEGPSKNSRYVNQGRFRRRKEVHRHIWWYGRFGFCRAYHADIFNSRLRYIG